MKQFFNFLHSLYPIPYTLYPRKGFTLIELLVVVGITIVISSILIVYSSDIREQNVLFIEDASVREVILRARALALSTYGEEGGTGVETCGYGVHIDYDTQTYWLTRSETENNPNDPCRRDKLFVHNDNGNGISRAVPMPSGKYLLDSSVLFVHPPGGVECDYLDDILFVPPEPRVVFNTHGGNACGPTVNSAMVQLKALGSSAGMTIQVNQFGQVSY